MQGASFWAQLQPTVLDVLQYLIPALGAALLAKLGHGQMVRRRTVRDLLAAQSDPPPPSEPFPLTPSSKPPKAEPGSPVTERSIRSVQKG